MEIPTRFQAADATLRQRQKDFGIIAHALTTGLDDLEGASKHLLSAVDDLEEGPIKDRILEAHREVTQASTHPLGHALRILASKYNDVANQKRTALAMTSSDSVLSQLIKTTPLGFDSLLDLSPQPAIRASSSRRQQDMLMAALRSNTRAPKPTRRDRSRSPVRRPHSNQNHSQGFRQSTDRQPFLESSRGSRGSGSRGTRGSRGSRGQRPFSRRSWISGPYGTVQGKVGPLRRGSGQGASARIRVEASSIKTKLPPVERMNKEREMVLQKEVDSVLSKGAVERVKDRKRGFYSNIFLVAKKDRGLRPVINLSGLNVYIKKKTFRMASLKDVSQSLCRGDWAATIDLKDANARPHSGAAQTLSPILVKGQQLSVQETALRTEFSSANVHEAHFAFGDPVPGQQSEDYLLGRFSGTRLFQAGTASSHETGVEHSRESRFSEKPQEVSLGAKTALRVSWAPVGYEGDKGLPTRGQDQRLQAVRTHSTLQPQSSLGPKICGQGDPCMPGRTVGPDGPATT